MYLNTFQQWKKTLLPKCSYIEVEKKKIENFILKNYYRFLLGLSIFQIFLKRNYT